VPEFGGFTGVAGGVPGTVFGGKPGVVPELGGMPGDPGVVPEPGGVPGTPGEVPDELPGVLGEDDPGVVPDWPAVPEEPAAAPAPLAPPLPPPLPPPPPCARAKLAAIRLSARAAIE
jgi:hypothetical protein